MNPARRSRLANLPIQALFVALVVAVSGSRGAAAEEPEAIATISFVIGDVLIGAQPSVRQAELNAPLRPGDRVRTGDESLCEISFRTGPILRLDSASEMVLEVPESAERGDISAGLSAGRLWSNCSRIFGDPERFRTASPTCVCGIRGTVWRLAVAADSTTVCRVYSGRVAVGPSWAAPGSPAGAGRPGPPREVPGPRRIAPPREVTFEEWLVIVGRNQEVTIGPDRSRPVPGPFDPVQDSRDDWVRWNLARDRALGR